MCSPSASSMVSQAARVGAMTMIRPVGGSAATNASWSGGRYLSITCLCIAWWKVHRSHRMRNGSGIIPEPFLLQENCEGLATVTPALALVLVLALAAIIVIVVVAVTPSVPIAAIVAAVIPVTLPLPVVRVRAARAENSHRAVGVTAGTLNDQVAVAVAGTTLVYGVVVRTLADLVPATVFAVVVIVTQVISADPSEENVSGTIGRPGVVTVVPASVIADRAGTDDRHRPVRVPACALDHDVPVAIACTALVDRVAVRVAPHRVPRPRGVADV